MSCKPRVMTRRQRASPEITPYDQAQSCVTRGADLPKEGRFEVRFINTVKGKGVFAVRNFKKGDYLMWYDGERLTGKEAAEREDVYDRTGDGSYMYFFKEKGKQVVIDATRTDTIARYINDEHKKPNCTVKKIADMTGTEHLCLFAIRDIHVNDEIHYNYGEGLDLPWRKEKTVLDPLSAVSQGSDAVSGAKDAAVYQGSDAVSGVKGAAVSQVSDAVSGAKDAAVSQGSDAVSGAKDAAVSQGSDAVSGAKDAAVSQGSDAVSGAKDAAVSQGSDAVSGAKDAAVSQGSDAVSGAKDAAVSQVSDAVSGVKGAAVSQGSGAVSGAKDAMLVGTNLTSQEMELLEYFANEIGSKLQSSFTNETTHVIVKTDSNLVCERTLKYFFGIAARKWVVSFNWILACVEEGRVIPEEQYEVCGDVVNGHNHKGPLKARLTTNKLLFQDYEICCVGSVLGISKDQLNWILQLSGADIITNPSLFSNDQSKKHVIIMDPDADDDMPDTIDCNSKSVLVASIPWIFDSVSQYSLQLISPYLLFDIKDTHVDDSNKSGSPSLESESFEEWSDDDSDWLPAKDGYVSTSDDNDNSESSSGKVPKRKFLFPALSCINENNKDMTAPPQKKIILDSKSATETADRQTLDSVSHAKVASVPQDSDSVSMSEVAAVPQDSDSVSMSEVAAVPQDSDSVSMSEVAAVPQGSDSVSMSEVAAVPQGLQVSDTVSSKNFADPQILNSVSHAKVAAVSQDSGSASVSEVNAVSQDSGSASVSKVAAVSQDSGSASVSKVGAVSQDSGSASVSKVGAVSQDSGSASVSKVGAVSQDSGSASVSKVAAVSQDSGSASVSKVAAVSQDSGSASVSKVGAVSQDSGSASVSKVAAVSQDSGSASVSKVAAVSQDSGSASVSKVAAVSQDSGSASVSKVAAVSQDSGSASVSKVAAVSQDSGSASVSKVAGVSQGFKCQTLYLVLKYLVFHKRKRPSIPHLLITVCLNLVTQQLFHKIKFLFLQQIILMENVCGIKGITVYIVRRCKRNSQDT
ncbi:streptococcal hemagglutinin-like isoform X2 [Ptychodera flava]